MSENDVKIDDIMGRLGFCNCGKPEVVLKFMRETLQYVKANEHCFCISPCEWLVVYVLEAHGYLDHGGSIGGAWLNHNGEAFLKELESLEL